MDQLYNFLKENLANVRGEFLKQRSANEAIRNDRQRRVDAGEALEAATFVPETILPLLDEPLQLSLTEGHLNSAFMRVGAYPSTRADMSADGVQNGESTDDFKQLIEQTSGWRRSWQNDIPNKFARPDLWAGRNNKLGSAVFVDEKSTAGRSARRVRACVQASVHLCVGVRARASVRACVRA